MKARACLSGHGAWQGGIQDVEIVDLTMLAELGEASMEDGEKMGRMGYADRKTPGDDPELSL